MIRSLLTALGCWCIFTPMAVTAEDKPNVVLIMADDLGYGDLSCYDGWIKTPSIDSIAINGVRFSDYHSNGNVCSPTRAALMTGLYQQRVGISGVVVAAEQNKAHFTGLQDREVTWPEIMQSAGYATGIYGKWHLGYYPRYNPVRHGFDHFIGYLSGNVDFISHIDQAGNADWWHDQKLTTEVGYSTHLITRHAVGFIDQHANRRPFFLYVPHEAPHYPYQGPNDKADRTVGGEFNNHGSREDKKQAYREMVLEMDRGVGEILECLRRNEILDNTIVIFCSDNGATSLGDNGRLRGTKGTDFEGGHRVPCVVQWPAGFPKGRVSHQLAMSMDWMPTILGITGLSGSVDRKPDGYNLTRAIRSPQVVVERTVVWNESTIRRGKWKLMLPQKKLNHLALFDLHKDLGEMNNLAGNYQAIVKGLESELAVIIARNRSSATKQPTTAPK